MGFNTGQTVMTKAVAERFYNDKDTDFAWGVISAMDKYTKEDWGDTSENDKPLNDEAVKTKDRIIAAYKIGEEKIWIITDCGHESTTILFPSEY